MSSDILLVFFIIAIVCLYKWLNINRILKEHQIFSSNQLEFVICGPSRFPNAHYWPQDHLQQTWFYLPSTEHLVTDKNLRWTTSNTFFPVLYHFVLYTRKYHHFKLHYVFKHLHYFGWVNQTSPTQSDLFFSKVRMQ